MTDRLDVGVVGAGRVGAVWAAALASVGHRVVGASGESEASRSRIETLIPGVPLLDPETIVRASDLVLLTVPDDALGGLVDDLAARGAWRRGQIAVHAAGRHGVGVLAAADAAGVACLAIHPAMTFTGTSLDLVRMRDALFAVTSLPALVPLATALVRELGGESVVVTEEHRPLYHAALSHGANHVVTAISQALEALTLAGVSEPGRLLGPLVRASVEGAVAAEFGGIASLTGPVVRGDAETVAAHVGAFAALPETLRTYRELARATAALACEAGRIDARQYASLMESLGLPCE